MKILNKIVNELSGGLLNKIVDKVLPNKLSPKEKEKLNQELKKALIEQENIIIKARKDIIVTEGSSEDPFVSRARPAFLWIMYFVIIFNYVFVPIFYLITKTKIEFLNLPADLWNLFTYGFLGYAGFRTMDKSNILSKFKK